MEAYIRHFNDRDKDKVGRRTGLIVSLGLHLAVVGFLFWASARSEAKPPPFNAVRVSLGGPPMVAQAGEKRKAPVAGVRKPQPKPAATAKAKRETPKTRVKPKESKKEVGLNRRKQPTKKTTTPPKETAAPARNETPAPEVTPPDKQKGPTALGGLDGSDGTGVGVEVGDGSEDIDEDDLEFISYFRTVQAEISKRWIKSGLTGGTTRVRFYINRDGSVANVQVAKSSGRSYLDGPARNAVLGSDFPPLPQGYLGEKLIVNINFQYGDGS